MSNDWTERDALAALATLPGVGRRSLVAVRQRFRSWIEAVEAPVEALAGALSSGKSGAGQALSGVGSLRGHLDRAEAAALAAGARLITELDAGWPSRLAGLEASEHGSEPPVCLYVRGDLSALEARFSVALVGSRHPDALAKEQATRFATQLAEAGVVVVSGAAQGVDGLAHRAALEAEGRTVAVLGTGVDVPYPRHHRRLLQSIVEEGGAVLSEMAPGTAPLPGLFPRRNRIVSGLADAVLVVAAAPGSGSLITAEHAWNQNRVVLTLPGDPRRPLSAGTNRLLVRGASAALEARHVLETLFEVFGTGRDGGRAAEWAAAHTTHDAGGAVATGPQFPLTGRARTLLGRLEAVPHAADYLAANTGLSGGEVAAGLAELELAGLAERVGGGYVLAGSAGMSPGGQRSDER